VLAAMVRGAGAVSYSEEPAGAGVLCAHGVPRGGTGRGRRAFFVIPRG